MLPMPPSSKRTVKFRKRGGRKKRALRSAGERTCSNRRRQNNKARAAMPKRGFSQRKAPRRWLGRDFQLQETGVRGAAGTPQTCRAEFIDVQAGAGNLRLRGNSLTAFKRGDPCGRDSTRAGVAGRRTGRPVELARGFRGLAAPGPVRCSSRKEQRPGRPSSRSPVHRLRALARTHDRPAGFEVHRRTAAAGTERAGGRVRRALAAGWAFRGGAPSQGGLRRARI